MPQFTQQEIFNFGTNQKLAKVWESFVDSGEYDSTLLRPTITNSWLKSRSMGLNPEIDRAQLVFSREELESVIRQEELALNGIPIINQITDILHDTKHVVVLADEQGNIIYANGHKQVQRELEEINFKPGAAWSEDVAGANGIGTPLQTGKPEIVMGYEHYCKGWQPWVCYGAPIYDALNLNIRGTIDITGPVDQVHSQTMALTTSLAHNIHSCLAMQHYKMRDKVREVSRDYMQRWSNDGILVLDVDARIIDTNSHAKIQLQKETHHLLNKPISDLFPNLTSFIHESISHNISAELELPADIIGNAVSHIVLKPIQEKNTCIGLLLVINQAKDLSPIDSNSESHYRAVGDELIRQTLQQTNHNVSRAARLLGIDRSTIYRRSRKWQNKESS